MITVRGWIIDERTKAVSFLPANDMTRPVWLPRSQIAITEREFDDLVEIPAWLAASNGIKTLPPAPRGRAHLTEG